MNLSNLLNRTTKLAKRKSPEILTGLSIAGVFTTSYLVGKAAFQAGRIIEYHESIADREPDTKKRLKEYVKETWRLYVPSAISGTVTIACIVGASRASSHQTAAATAAYTITERAFSEYRDKVIEEVGKGKEEKIRDEIVQNKINELPVTSKEVVVLGNGQVLCCELYTRRYFKSDMETLRKAQNDVNQDVVNQLYVTLSEFYDLVGLAHTTYSDVLGWDSTKLMELNFSTVLSDNGEPCLAFDYNYIKPID